MVTWLSMLRLATLEWGARPGDPGGAWLGLAAYCIAHLAAYSSVPNTGIYHGGGKIWDLMIEPDGW